MVPDVGSGRVAGVPVRRRRIDGDDDHAALYPVPGVKFDLEFAKKLQAMKTKAAASQPNEPGRQGGDETAPAPRE